MNKRDEKEILAKRKYSKIFESVQRDISRKSAELAEKFSVRGLLHSGPHAMARVDLEVEGVRILLSSKLEIDMDVFFKQSKPHTEDDKNFLEKRIRQLFEARAGASRKSIEDFHQRYGLPHLEQQFQYFNREANGILSGIIRDIEITILENRISSPELPEIDIDALIKMDESDQLEFKSSLQWDVRRKCKNVELRKEVISTIAAFNNTYGGDVVIGVDDDGNIFGLEMDYSLLKKSNMDGFQLLLTQDIENCLSKDFATKVDISFHKVEHKDICRIRVKMGDDAVWVKVKKSNEIFYIRTQNSTRALSPKEAAEYIKKKWPYSK